MTITTRDELIMIVSATKIIWDTPGSTRESTTGHRSLKLFK